MQIKEYLKGVYKAVFPAIAKSFPNIAPGFAMAFGERFNILYANNMGAYYNKIFYSAQNLLVRKYTETPILFNKVRKDQNRKFSKFYSNNITNEKRAALKTLALEEQENHPLNTLFDKPNSYQSGIELMDDFWHNYGFGDGYLWFANDLGTLSRNSMPKEVHSLNKQRVAAIPSATEPDGIGGYTYTLLNGNQVNIPKSNILHLKKWNPNQGELYGLDPSKVVAATLSLDSENALAQGSAFKNGGTGTLFSSDIHVDAQGQITEKMTAPQMEVLKDNIQRDFAGSVNNRRLHFTNGKVEVTPYGDTLAEMELVAAGTTYWEYTYATLGIPDVLCPTTKASTENNVKAGYKALVTNTIIPDLRKFDQSLTRKIQLWWNDIIACHDLTEFTELAPDLKLMAEVYGKPASRVDEVRLIFGLDEIGGEEGQAILVTSGQMQLKDLISNEFDQVPNPDSPNSPNAL